VPGVLPHHARVRGLRDLRLAASERNFVDADSLRSLTDEQVLNEFGKAMVAHSYGYYDFTERMEALRGEALRRMREYRAT
jgi:hypothetical protein